MTQTPRAHGHGPIQVDDFERAMAKIAGIVGESHLTVAEADRQAVSRDTSPWRRLCSAIVHPASVEEVSAVMRTAQDAGLPVWPFASGKNWGNGGSQAFHAGDVVLMLDRMNRILEVDERLAYALLEPGVTQAQLHAHLRRQEIKLWMDCTDSTPNASVVGNALERGVGYGAHWDHFAALCGLEVVLPDGKIVRTGGGPPGAKTWNTFKWGTGPSLEGLFAQSNLGVVTKAGVWLMPEPQTCTMYLLEIDSDEELFAAVDVFRQLTLDHVIPANFHVANDLLFFAQMTQYPFDMLDGGRFLSDEALAQLRRRYHVSRWTVIGGLYGRSPVVKASKAVIRKQLGRFGRLTFLGKNAMAGVRRLVRYRKALDAVPGLQDLIGRLAYASPEKLAVVPHIDDILRGVPSEYIVSFAYFKSRKARPRTDVDPVRDQAGFRWVAIMAPMTGDDMRQAVAMCRPLYGRRGFDYAVSLIMVNPRTILVLMPIFFDWDDPDDPPNVEPLHDEIVAAAVAQGYQQYRISVAYSDRVLAPAPGYRAVADRLKRAVDPNGVLAPGRYGLGLADATGPEEEGSG